MSDTAGKKIEWQGLHGLIWEAPNARDILVYLHGVESHSLWFQYCARELVRQGVSVLAYDRPGFGQSAGEQGHVPHYQDLVDQVVEAGNRISSADQSMHLAGMSWGGLLALCCVAQQPDVFATAHFIAPGWFPTGAIDWKKFIDSPQMIPLAMRTEQFTANPDHQAWIDQDPFRTTAVRWSFGKASLEMQLYMRTRISKLTTKSYLYLAEKDEIINNIKTLKLFNRLTNAPENTRTFENARHSLVMERPEKLATSLIQNIHGDVSE